MAVDDLYARIKAGVKTILEADELFQLEIKGGVVDLLLDDTNNLAWPCITISLDGMTPTVLAGDTETFFWEFPMLVLIRDQDEIRQANRTKYLTWWQRLYSLFHQRPPTGGIVIPECPEVYRSSVRPRQAVDANLARYPNAVSAIELRFEAATRRHA